MLTTLPGVLAFILIITAHISGFTGHQVGRSVDEMATHVDENPPNQLGPHTLILSTFITLDDEAPTQFSVSVAAPLARTVTLTPSILDEAEAIAAAAWLPVPPPIFVESYFPHANSDARQICYQNPDRYEWRKYALAAGFPESVLPELEYIISTESGFDLCAVNREISGATCWIQQTPGGDDFFDPTTCMAQGYYKWVAGGRDFWQHWYQWWNPVIRTETVAAGVQ